MSYYEQINIGGGDTGAPINIERRFRIITTHIDLRQKYILDCGCGRGDYLLRFSNYSPNAFGVEYNEEKVNAFKSLNVFPDNVAQGNIENLSFDNDTFDFVLLNEVLEHVPKEISALKQIYRVLKPKGILALFSPNRLYPFETHGVTLKKVAIPLPHYFPFIPYLPVAIGNKMIEYRARNYFPWELKQKVRRVGFEIVEHTFIWQTFENISGNLPKLIMEWAPVLRRLSFACEKLPVIRIFGVSQVIIGRK